MRWISAALESNVDIGGKAGYPGEGLIYRMCRSSTNVPFAIDLRNIVNGLLL